MQRQAEYCALVVKSHSGLSDHVEQDGSLAGWQPLLNIGRFCYKPVNNL